MTAINLPEALLVGIGVGAVGHLTMPRGRIPFWVTVGVAAAAVALGTLVARMSGIGAGEFSIAELLIQVVFGTTGIALLGGTADRRRAEHRDPVA